MRIPELLFSLSLAALVSPVLHAQILDVETLAIGNESVGEWYNHNRHIAIDGVISTDTELDTVLNEARDRIEGALLDVGQQCDAVEGEVGQRSCDFIANLKAYEEFLRADQRCRVGGALSSITNPASSTETIMDVVSEATKTLGDSAFASLDLFQPERFDRDLTVQLFGQRKIEAGCAEGLNLDMVTIIIPFESVAVSDKLMLAYSLALSFTTLEYNRSNIEATAEQIRLSNERWLKFETNVIHDQYPWETLLFNDWLAGTSSRFRGTLTHPPTQQIRALHPVPTAILDVSGDDLLFRPRISVEVIGLRYLNETDYTPKRAVSIIATLGAEAGESTGWGLLYTWKRASLGVIYQDTADDGVIGLVFGIDFANQVNSRRNNLMEDWQSLRTRLKGMEEQLP